MKVIENKKEKLKIKYYIKDIEENSYIDVYDRWYWEEYVLTDDIIEVQECIYFSKQEAIWELQEMADKSNFWRYIIEEVFEI